MKKRTAPVRATKAPAKTSPKTARKTTPKKPRTKRPSKAELAQLQHRQAQQRMITVVAVLVLLAIVAGSGIWRYHTHSQQQHHRNTRLTMAEEPLHPRTKTPIAPQPVPPPTPVPVPAAPTPVHDTTIPPITNGLAPVIIRLATKEPVVFLGIDDGGNKQAFELQMLKDNHVNASLFLANAFIKNDPYFFTPFVAAGSLIEDHSVTHRLLSGLPYEVQKQEICGQAELEQQHYGRRPVLFRPPGGDYDITTQRAAADCGMKAVVNWIAKANGGSMQYQIGHALRPGDIVLMHFRPEFKSDMQSFLDAAQASGLHTELLEDWLPTQ